MNGWTCPECRRRFARTKQGHECAPAMSLEEYLATGPPHERPVVEAVLAFLERLGPVHVEPVSVGILLKAPVSFAELRPMTRWEALGLGLPRRATHPRIARKPVEYGRGWWHVANVRDVDDLDADLLALLEEAYEVAAATSAGRRASGS